jgi:hypothetical protein
MLHDVSDRLLYLAIPRVPAHSDNLAKKHVTPAARIKDKKMHNLKE